MSQPEPLRFRPIDLTGVYVLVVDDYEDTLELFRSALEAFGAEVVTARSARDALTIMKTARVNAMVFDLAMPGEDGLWLVQQLRRLKSTQGGGIPAIAITAHRERYAAERVREFGFEAFLTKPIFFFQAEDGIRDLTVTGVQTCALPIYKWQLAIDCIDDAIDDFRWRLAAHGEITGGALYPQGTQRCVR